MRTVRTTLTALAVTGAVAVPTALVLAGPAQADVESAGRCAGAFYELSVDRERGRFEVEGSIDDAAPRSAWRVVMRHEGEKIADVTRRADGEGDLDVDRLRPNTAGADEFRLRVTDIATGETCRTVVTTR